MIEIKDLLIHFQNILLSNEVKKEAIRGVVSKAIKTLIKKEDIEIKNNTIFLNIKPIYKNEIFIKKDFIIFELEKILGNKTPRQLQ